MKILILGAGQVGSTAAYSLAREEANEVTIVDRDPEVLREVAPTSISPTSLGENERETLKEPPLWLFFGIFGGGIGTALFLQRRKERRSVE